MHDEPSPPLPERPSGQVIGPPPAPSKAQQKEKFDQCIAMLKAYYDAIEARLGQNITGHTAAVGWFLTSDTARKSMKDPVLFYVGLAVAFGMLCAYAFNIRHYVKRWRDLRKIIDALEYMEPTYYQRYNLPAHTAWTYLLPVAVLSSVLMFLMWFAANSK